jgi:hypothetical protein
VHCAEPLQNTMFKKCLHKDLPNIVFCDDSAHMYRMTHVSGVSTRDISNLPLLCCCHRSLQYII